MRPHLCSRRWSEDGHRTGICQSCDHLNILLRSSRSISASRSSPTALHSFVSSANLEILDKIPSSMSLMKITNKSGPSADIAVSRFANSVKKSICVDIVKCQVKFCLLLYFSLRFLTNLASTGGPHAARGLDSTALRSEE